MKSVESKDHTSTELNQDISTEPVEEQGKDKDANVEEEADEIIAQNETDDGTNDSKKEADRLKAIKIHHIIRDTILPQLHKSMVRKVSNLSFLNTIYVNKIPFHRAFQ